MTVPVRSRRHPHTHWALLLLLLLALVVALLLQGYATHEVGGSGTPLPARTSASVPGGGPVLYDDGGRLASRPMPAKTVALSFDDGPDPVWTPKLLAVLRREHVPATFFAVGSRVAAYPGLVRDEARLGDVGVHTFTHADVSQVPGWRRNLELSLEQLTLAGATGHVSALMRPPYSSTPDALTPRDVAAYRQIASAGYLVVLADRDSEDWRRPGVNRIVSNALPTGSAGAVVLMHDGGGNRSETVAALPRLIDTLRSRGYRFATVSSALGLAPASVAQPVQPLRRAQGIAFIGIVTGVQWLAIVLSGLLLGLGVLAVLRTLLLLALAHRHVGVARSRLGGVLDTWHLPPVTVVVPAYNEAVGIEAAVRSLVASDYPELEVVVVDDGSTDGTGDIAEALALPGVRVVRQRNSGKFVALNTGIAHARHDVIVMVDGDTVFRADTVRWLVQPMRDPTVGAVSGNTKVGNRRRLLGKWQHIEYVVGFNLDRRMYDLLRCMPTVPGAVGAFRRAALAAVGGVSGDTLAEDTDLTMAVNRAGWRVVYEERALAWTEAPSTLTGLWRQRYRWCYGTLQAVWKHRGAVRATGPGRALGLVGLPYLLAFQVVLPLIAPVVDLFALYGLVFLNPWRVAAYWLGFLLLQVGAGAYALRLDRESLRPLWSLPLQQLVYRQLMYLVVIQSVVSAVSGVRLRWHKLERTGDVLAEVPDQPRAPSAEVTSRRP